MLGSWTYPAYSFYAPRTGLADLPRFVYQPTINEVHNIRSTVRRICQDPASGRTWVLATNQIVANNLHFLAALNNLLGFSALKRWRLAFVFGLVHGFGFASVLLDLGLPASALLAALGGFNLGVELGQLAIVGAFLPLAWGLRRTWFYRWVLVFGGSSTIVVLGLFWTFERLGWLN